MILGFILLTPRLSRLGLGTIFSIGGGVTGFFGYRYKHEYALTKGVADYYDRIVDIKLTSTYEARKLKLSL